jgi:hypothetical protein
MLRILKIDEKLAAAVKPPLVHTEVLQLRDVDCLILCSGFEDRALAFLKVDADRSQHRTRILSINYLPFMGENRREEIRDICQTAGFEYRELTYDRQNPSGFADTFSGSLGVVEGRVFVDVSAMSRLMIVQILVSLARRAAGFTNTTILYSEASEYPPDKSAVEEAIKRSDVDPLYSIMLLSSGVFDITVVPELSSISLDGQQTRLVAFPSFNTDQLTALRTELQPSRYSIIHGDPPSEGNKWRAEAIAKLNHTETLNAEEHYTTNTLDYRETLDCLLKIYREHGATERILIAPTGSKMQAVAVGIFRAFVEDVQVVYPTPRAFTSPTSYTLGVGNRYCLPLDSFYI